VIGFGARRAIAVLQKQNVTIGPLLQRAGLSKRDLADWEYRISATAQSKLLESAADALGDNAFGLHLAEQTNPREAGLLFYLISAAKDLGDALALLARYFRIVNEAVRLKLGRGSEGVVVEIDFVDLSRHAVRHNTEFGVASILKALREAAARDIRPTKVTFAIGRDPKLLREFERFYGCPVEFGAQRDQLVFSNETLAFPVVTEDRYLLRTLRPIADEAARKRGTARQTLRASVESEIQRLLPHGKARRQAVAEALAMSQRTLSRRLADEGATYDKVVEELRRSLAIQYIKEPGLSLPEIAWLLGYQSASSFSHAFRRWTGRPPSAPHKGDSTPRLAPRSVLAANLNGRASVAEDRLATHPEVSAAGQRSCSRTTRRESAQTGSRVAKAQNWPERTRNWPL
jgi:AraC-like DNA-binding protein